MSDTLTQDPHTEQTTIPGSSPVEDRGDVSKTTTYVVLTVGKQDVWAVVGEFVVPVGRSDKAKDQALKQLATTYTDETAFTLTAVPAKSWQPETFELEQPAPSFKKKVA